MASREPIKLRRHCSELSEKQTDEVVGILADLIVNYVKNTTRATTRDEDHARETQEVQA